MSHYLQADSGGSSGFGFLISQATSAYAFRTFGLASNGKVCLCSLPTEKIENCMPKLIYLEQEPIQLLHRNLFLC
jgi:hypothetical protein